MLTKIPATNLRHFVNYLNATICCFMTSSGCPIVAQQICCLSLITVASSWRHMLSTGPYSSTPWSIFFFLFISTNFQFPLNFNTSTCPTSGGSFKIVYCYLLLLAGYGNFTFKMDFYESSSFSTPYTHKDYPLYMPLDEYVYLGCSVESSADLVLMAVDCKATKDGSFYSWPQYTFIENG